MYQDNYTIIVINFSLHFQGCWKVQGCNQGLPTAVAERPGRPHCDGARPPDWRILSGGAPSRNCAATFYKIENERTPYNPRSFMATKDLKGASPLSFISSWFEDGKSMTFAQAVIVVSLFSPASSLYLFFPLGAAQQRADEGSGEGLHCQGQWPSPHGYKWQDKFLSKLTANKQT